MRNFYWLLAVLALAGCGAKETQTTSTAAPATNTTTSGNPVTAPVDYLGAVSKAQQSAVKTTSTLGLQQAINHFQVSEGRYPKDLNELVAKEHIAKLPAPPAGMKFEYDPATGQVKAVKQ
jgi:hypothetical protein